LNNNTLGTPLEPWFGKEWNFLNATVDPFVSAPAIVTSIPSANNSLGAFFEASINGISDPDAYFQIDMNNPNTFVFAQN